MWVGAAYALGAGLTWGLVFVAPLMLSDYPAPLLSAARYLAFGVIALPLAWWDRQELSRLSRQDWAEALRLSAVGNLAYYLFLSAAIQRSGGPLPTMIIGTLPVVIAITAKLSAHTGAGAEPSMAWGRLAPSLVLIAIGIACVNEVELPRMRLEGGATSSGDLMRYVSGVCLALAAVACWTWYPLRNARWLRAHAQRSPRAWATAQGLATLPLSALAFGAFWLWNDFTDQPFVMPWGPHPQTFIGLMLSIGLLASWVGTLCWNEASQRLPPTLSGQLIVFETLAALGYAWALRGRWPDAMTGLGALLLVAGVVWALRQKPT
ncbi:MAG: hypothetical protein RI949_2445 [Pseudomonadota bacterium]|jgi:drug/metabolite transporter (DMT)-like permease